MIEVVLFDYGGTLFKSTRRWHEVRAEGLASAHRLLTKQGLEMTLDEFKKFGDSVFKEYEELEAKDDRDVSDLIKYQEIVDALLPQLPAATRKRLASDANRAFWQTAAKSYPIRKSAVKALEGLRSKGLRMGVVSNHHHYEALVWHLERTGIRSHFDVILASEREGVRKPNRAIFARSLEAMGVKSEHAIFVGDSPKHDILGARGAGITAVLIDDGDQHDTRATPKTLAESKGQPDFVIDDLLALHEIVDYLRGDTDELRSARLWTREKPKARVGNPK
ncbi:MAG TPA: HAD family hydrolase [Nitrososphaerales archaeon]|nr:HAD family hydrolase [Nitrososphaerales archaeon]